MLFSLSLVKASQRNMVQSFNRTFSETGVHCGLISVEGVVGEDGKGISPKTVASKTVAFWESGEGLEVNIKA